MLLILVVFYYQAVLSALRVFLSSCIVMFYVFFVPYCAKMNDNDQGRSQEFATGDKRGGLGDRPPAGSRGRAPVGVWGEAPRSRRQMLISTYDGGTCTHAPLGHATDNDDNLYDAYTAHNAIIITSAE